MKNKDPRTITAREYIKELSKKLARVQQKYQQTKDVDRKKTLALCIDDIKMNIGWLLLDCGDYEKGLAIYQSMSWRTHGEDKYNGICRALIEMEYYDEARRLLERGLQRFPESHCLLVGMGLLHKHLGHSLDALGYFKQALKCGPGDRHALYDKALTLSELGYYEDSLSIVRKLTKKYPDDPEYLIETGYCTLMMGYPENAIEYYKKAGDTGYVSPSIYCGLCCAYMEMGLKEDALETAEEGLREFPDVAAMYENLGECYFEKGWTDDAKSVLQEGLKKFPDDEGIKELLDKIEEDEKDPDKGSRPPIGCLLIFLSLILNKFRKKW